MFKVECLDFNEGRNKVLLGYVACETFAEAVAELVRHRIMVSSRLFISRVQIIGTTSPMYQTECSKGHELVKPLINARLWY